MQNRLIFSARFSTAVFVKIFLLTLSLVFLMSLLRLNLFFLSIFQGALPLDPWEVLQSFIMGARFDLLIFGFILIPVYVVVIVQGLCQKWQPSMTLLCKVYFSLVWFIICALSYVDFFHFAHYGRRMYWVDYTSLSFSTLLQQIASLPLNQNLIYSIATVLLILLGFMLIRGIRFGYWKDKYSPEKGSWSELMWRVLVPLALIVLAARGTLTPHHLAREHSEISSNKAVNEMALNPIWCFDK